MSISKSWKTYVALAAAAAMVVPAPQLAASQPASSARSSGDRASSEGTATAPAVTAPAVTEWSTIHDVVLSPEGSVTGTVVDMQGAAVSGEPVIALWQGREVALATTDRSGRFVFEGLRGGVYEIRTAHGGRLFRLWAHGTAPLSAQSAVLLVTQGRLVRGQRPLGELFTSNVFVITAIVAAAVAIPIAVTNSKSDRAPQS